MDRWPQSVDGARAVRLGLPRPPGLERIVEEYLEDYGGGNATGAPNAGNGTTTGGPGARASR
ncbi:MAG: hypothetical protein JNL97_17725 [Verrucomicrobiales bacterium]|nr:hypothetical protein [Verrucomicrobiales bacterium]